MQTIMEAAKMRQKLHQYVDSGDEKLLKLMYAVAKEYTEDDNVEYEFNEEEIKLYEDRREKRLNNESKIYGWSEAKEIITGKKKI